jgi:hypothetical protein
MSTDEIPDGPLYHYCSMGSLYGILDSLTLRLTNIRYMNDSKEISWLYEHAKNVVLTRMRHGQITAEYHSSNAMALPYVFVRLQFAAKPTHLHG